MGLGLRLGLGLGLGLVWVWVGVGVRVGVGAGVGADELTRVDLDGALLLAHAVGGAGVLDVVPRALVRVSVRVWVWV